MISLSGEVSSASTEDGGGTDEVGASEVTTGNPSATEIGDTATKAPDTPSERTQQVVDFAQQVPGEVLRVGVSGSRSIPDNGGDSAASVADSGSAPPVREAGGSPKPVLVDLPVDATTNTNEVVARAPDTSSRGVETKKKRTEEGNTLSATKESSDEAKAEANVAATKPVRLTHVLGACILVVSRRGHSTHSVLGDKDVLKPLRAVYRHGQKRHLRQARRRLLCLLGTLESNK